MMDFRDPKIKFEISENALWMPVYTLPLHEFRLQGYLTERGIPNYLPVVPVWKIQQVKSDKKSYQYKRRTMRPMFRSYLFAQLSPESMVSAWQSKSVIGLLEVGRARQEEFVQELRAVRLMEELGRTSELDFRPEFKVGDLFVIDSGCFEGTCGRLLKKRKQFLWTVQIECMQTCITTEIDPSAFQLRKMDEK